MAKPKPRKNQRQHLQTPPEPTSVSVRLPGEIAQACRAYSGLIGISQNALICVALADYLRSKGFLETQSG